MTVLYQTTVLLLFKVDSVRYLMFREIVLLYQKIWLRYLTMLYVFPFKEFDFQSYESKVNANPIAMDV